MSTVIFVTGAAPRLESHAEFLAGERAEVEPVALTVEETVTGPVLVIRRAAGREVRWPFDELRSLPDQADRDSLIVASARNPVARLIVSDAGTLTVLRRRCRNLLRRPPSVGRARLIGWAAAAVASVALIILVLVPVMADQLAVYLPPEGEKALGDTTLEQIRGALSEGDFAPLAFCEAPAGRAALDRMAARMGEGVALPYAVTLHVLDSKIINAFALPGGHIVFFRGLIEAAESPEEVAAVYAHELGHVVNRDPTRSALRTAGSIGVLGLLLGDFAGGTVVLLLAERLIEASYSQEAEAAADSFAHERMIAAGLRPDALADIFERLREEHGDAEGLVKHFLAHPTLGDRIAAARAAAEGVAAGAPILNSAEWQALRAICR